MENASKALLIAAAVLVVILIIAFGMQIFSSSSGTTEQVGSTMNSTEAQAFNAQFTGFKGSQKASAVRNLLIAITTSNKSNPAHQINCTTKLNSITDENKIYNVVLEYDENTGYISKITINESK